MAVARDGRRWVAPKLLFPNLRTLHLTGGFRTRATSLRGPFPANPSPSGRFGRFFGDLLSSRGREILLILLRFEPEIIRRRWRWRRVFAPTAVIPTVRERSSPDKIVAGHLFREMTANRVAIRAEEGSAPPLDDHHRWSAVGRRRERRPAPHSRAASALPTRRPCLRAMCARSGCASAGAGARRRGSLVCTVARARTTSNRWRAGCPRPRARCAPGACGRGGGGIVRGSWC